MNIIVPKKDGLYALKLENIGYISPTEERFVMENPLAGNLSTGEDIENVYTLVSYKGKGMFQEYYTGEKAVLCTSVISENEFVEGPLAHYNDEKLLTYSNEQEKNSKFEFFKRVPLVVDARSLMDITPEILDNINTNNLGDSIRQYVSKLKEDVILQDFGGVAFNEADQKSKI